MTLDEIRKNFNYLNENSIYFNHASTGPLSNSVINRINEHLLGRSSGKISNYEQFLTDTDSSKQKLSKLLNCEKEQLAWVQNIATAMSILVNGIEWNVGDQIIINDLEFPSNVYPFLNLQSKGVEVKFVKNMNGKIFVSDIEKLITNKTRLIAISFVQFLTGWKSNIEEIGKICDENNIIYSVDAIQAAGVVEIDIKKMGIDFLTGGTQKWLMALQGCSYFYASEKLINKLNLSIVGWNTVKNQWDFSDYKLIPKDSAERFEAGTPNAIGIAAADESLDLFLNYGMENINERIFTNTKYFMMKLNSIGIKTLLDSDSMEHLAGIVTIKSERSSEIFKHLQKNKIYSALREGMLRFSPHFYNTKEEIDEVIHQIKKSNNIKSKKL